jgi:6-phosphogluconolactonase (cycloisomerase 2 family)
MLDVEKDTLRIMHNSLRTVRHWSATLGLALTLASGAFGQVLLYVPTQASNQLWEYGVTSGTGALTNYPAQSTSNQPNVVAVTPNNRFMYVGDQDGTIDAFVVNYDGTLTAVGPPLANAGSVRGLGIDTAGNFLYASNESGNEIRAFSINQTTGALTASATVSLGSGGPRGMAVDNAGHLYVVLSNSGLVAQYSINSSTGALTQIAAPISTGAAGPSSTPDRIAVNPSGTFAYVANIFDSTIRGYTIAAGTGALTPSGPLVNTGNQVYGLTVHNNGQFLIATANNLTPNNNVMVYQIGGSGLLTPAATNTAGSRASGVAVDPSGNFVYVANSFSASITKFSFNPSTGALTAPATFATGDMPMFLMSRPAPIAPPSSGVPAASTWSLGGLGILLTLSSAILYRRAYR